MSTQPPTEDWREWQRSINEDLVPKIDGSAYVASFVPQGDIDAKFCVELGVSIMLDKPILVMVMPGAVVPDRLRRVADEILEVDLHTEHGQQEAATAIRAFGDRHTDRGDRS